MLRDAGELARILISLADRQAGESLLYGPRSFWTVNIIPSICHLGCKERQAI